MMDLFVIKNEKLRSLMENSAKFNSLSDEKQREHIERIENLSAAQQEKVREFFAKENEKEKVEGLSDKEKIAILSKLFDEVKELERRFSKLFRKETEVKDREGDNKKMNELLSKLN